MTAEDDCGREGTCLVTYTWQIVTAPVFDNCVTETVDLGCNPATPVCDPGITATNECGNVSVSCNESPIINVGLCGKSRVLTYMATDCGFSSACSRTIT
ncbi:MAG: hypothetical protein IPM98_20265 [Lewinellaceae bacterium]|nr:hypothetical protein [Lewinellaceae bacterium]